MKKNILVLTVLLSFLLSQSEQPYPPVNLVSIPTAGTMPKGYFSFENIFMNEGSIVPKFMIGITDNFMLGISFGISNFIGDGNIKKNRSYPEVQIKYRIFDETDKMPAMLVGIDTQGRGNFFDEHSSISLNRYEQKSYGLYFVISRNWNALGNLGFHFGLNKNTFENNDGDEDVNLFFGIDKEINDSFSLLMEYNFARDDDEVNDTELELVRLGKGYLNAGIRWAATDNLLLEINVNDILKNSVYNSSTDDEFESMNREVKVIYYEYF